LRDGCGTKTGSGLVCGTKTGSGLGCGQMQDVGTERNNLKLKSPCSKPDPVLLCSDPALLCNKSSFENARAG